MVERIAEVVREKKVEGIAEVRDESDREGIRVVIELKREADPDVVLNQLSTIHHAADQLRHQHGGAQRRPPRADDAQGMLVAFLEFREEVITRRSAFELAKARERAHVLLGLAVAVANIDEIIALIRSAPDPADGQGRAGRARLAGRGRRRRCWRWSRTPARTTRAARRHLPAVRAAGQSHPRAAPAAADRARARQDPRRAEEIAERIQALLLILRSRERLLEVVKEELLAVRSQFADARRTEIDADADADVDIQR